MASPSIPFLKTAAVSHAGGDLHHLHGQAQGSSGSNYSSTPSSASVSASASPLSASSSSHYRNGSSSAAVVAHPSPLHQHMRAPSISDQNGDPSTSSSMMMMMNNGYPTSSSSSSANAYTHASTSTSTLTAPTTASSSGTSIIPLSRTNPHHPNGHHQHQHHLQHLTQHHHLLQHPSLSSSLHSGGPAPSTGSSLHSYPHPQSHPQSPSTSSITSGNGNGAAPSPSSPSPTTSNFIRDGDIVYEDGPPPAPPAPVVGTRSYTILKEVGDGSFGTVWLADWHSPLAVPKGTGPPGPSSRPEYKGKRLVALKRMKKAFEGGWDECMKLKELKSLRSIPAHPNVIPLYDAFLLPSTKELYFVFECMEGNLYQLTKSRKGRPLAAGLVASLLQQIIAGLHHIHLSGYFHRDMKPENLLITTTGLADYPAYVAPQNVNNPSLANRPPEKDVVAVIKIADFGLARETRSKPPYTEYVSTRWYRAPEVILRSRDYSHPVDMWAIGTILSEMVNLKPLFPGQSEVDQVFRICEVLGDPTSDYGIDERSRIKGGGYWERSIKMAKAVGFSFPKVKPMIFESLYDKNLVPFQLVDMMADLMRYEPRLRLTTAQCLDHPYFHQVTPHLQPTPIAAVPNHIRQQQQQLQQQQQQKVHALPTPSSSSSQPQPYPGILPSPTSSSFPAPRNVPSSHTQASQVSRPSFEARHHFPSGMAQPAPGSAYSSSSSYQSPHPAVAITNNAADYQASPHQHQQQVRDRQVSVAHSLNSNESMGLSGMQMLHGASAPSPAVGYPESVNDISMDGVEEGATSSNGHHHLPSAPSPVPSSVYSYGQGQGQGGSKEAGLPPPHGLQPSHLPPPHQHYTSSYQQHLRQGINGYPTSTHSGSLYNSSIYSGLSGHSAGSGGRKGSAGGASTFYDGSIFEGIAPTRAASILSLPVTYGEAPPSPKFAVPHNYPSSIHSHQPPSNLGPNGQMAALRRARTESDNISVDFEREALQRSQNLPHLPQGTSATGAGVPKSDSQESLKASKGKKSWMSNLLSNNSSSSTSSSTSQQPHYHPQQQPLINPANYAASSASSLHQVQSIHSGSSLKRTPSERSIHAPEQPPTQPAATQQSSAPLDPKKAKKEAERLAKEAEKAKREAATKAARERARAVMQKRNALAQAADPLHSYGQQQMPVSSSSSTGATAASGAKALSDKEKKAIIDQRKQQALANGAKLPQIAEDPRMRLSVNQYSPDARYKARRRDDDDDVHSMSSNETRSERRFSISSHNTMSTVSTTNTLDSDPGPARPGRQGGFLAPVRRSPSVSSFSGQSHLSVGSTGSGQAPTSGYGRRDLGTSGSGTSSLEYGLVGRFKGLSAADGASSSTSPTSASSHPDSPHYFRPPHSPSQMSASHQQHNISLPSIQSFDRPPPKEFSFPNGSGHGPQAGTPHTAHSNHSNGSTISANSQQYSQSTGQLPFTPEMYHHQLHHSQQSQT